MSVAGGLALRVTLSHLAATTVWGVALGNLKPGTDRPSVRAGRAVQTLGPDVRGCLHSRYLRHKPRVQEYMDDVPQDHTVSLP